MNGAAFGTGLFRLGERKPRGKNFARFFFLQIYGRSRPTDAKAICGRTSLRVAVLALLYEALKAGVNVKAVLRSLNTAFLPISRSRFKQH